MNNTGQQQPQIKHLVEEKHYRLEFDEGAPYLKQAIEHALGMKLDVLAPGMWSGTKEADKYSNLEATVRALRTEDGMSVEVRLEHRFNAKAITLFTVGLTLGCILLLPLIPTIMTSVRVHREHTRQRLIEMHKVWTEVAEAVGAPRRAGYREQPKRAYAPMRINDAGHERAEREQAELEAAHADEASDLEQAARS